MTISHQDIWNHRCQATNLVGSSEQTTPVTVRHAGGSNVQWPMSKVRCQFQCQSKKSQFQNVKESISKISIPRSSNGQLQCRACWWFIVLQLWSDLPGFFKTIFCAKVWGTGPFFRYIITLIEAIWLPWNDAVPSWFLFYSDSVPRGCPLSNRQLLSERRQLRLLQVHRRVGLQVMRSDLIQSPLVISCVGPKHKQIL